MSAHIRDAGIGDLAAINEVYNHYVTETHVSFDVEPWSAAQRVAWFETKASTGRHQVLVADVEGGLAGVSYSSVFRPKVAYDPSVETTILLRPEMTGRGLGSTLLSELLERLSREDVHRAYAIIALPNEASVALHEKLGYRSLGVQDEAGRKFGKYWSTELYEYRF